MTATEMRFLRMRDVTESVALSRPTIYRMMDRGEFPRPVKVGPNSLWVKQEVDDWMKAQMAARTHD